MGTTLHALIQDNEKSLQALQQRIGYSFTNIELLQVALIHSSFAFEQLDGGRHNETQEFLGDAVLDLAVGYILFKRFPRMREGKLTRIRSALVNESGLAQMARAIGLGGHLLLGRGEEGSNGREKSSILCCAYEALGGALFLAGGYDEALDFVQRFFGPLIDKRQNELMLADAKSSLQEVLQERYNEGPHYALEEEEGPAHARIFSVSVRFHGRVLGTGRAGSKKEAEQQAAGAALARIKEENSSLFES
jgi:ribonuclease-3